MISSKFEFLKNIRIKRTKKVSEPKVNNNSGKIRKFMSRISGAFMLPISVMAIAGLFLGIGALIESQAKLAHIGGLEKFGVFIKNMGDPVFGAMPILFAAAMIVVFTDEAGVAVFAGIIGYLIFVALQVPFITKNENVNAGQTWNAAKNIFETRYGQTILFDVNDEHAKAMAGVVGQSLGFSSLNTSVFGGIVVGGIVSYLYNKFHTITLPQIFSFFGGKRFVSLVSIIAMVPLSLLTLLIWPWIGRGLSIFGNALSSVPAGLESFIFGFIERALIPFGLHHAFYAPLWWSNAGGEFGQNAVELITTAKKNGILSSDQFTQLSTLSFIGGDQTLWAKASSLAINEVNITKASDPSKQVIAAGSYPLFEFISSHATKLGKFMAGKFSFMMFGLPAAAAAMVMAAPKENRKIALGSVVPAALTSFVTGVTEPIEFTFLFLAPWLFFGFHAIMAAFSFMFANLAGVHTGMTFSGGIFDIIIYGAIPFAKGTNFYWSIVIGLGYIPIYYFAFLFFIKRFNLATPGRGGNVKLFTKSDVLNKNKTVESKTALTEQSKRMVIAFGGWDNIVKMSNCATRLRYDIKDKVKVDEEGLKAAGAVGVVWQGTNHVQAIIGPQAEQININIKNNIGSELSNSTKVVKTKVV